MVHSLAQASNFRRRGRLGFGKHPERLYSFARPNRSVGGRLAAKGDGSTLQDVAKCGGSALLEEPSGERLGGPSHFTRRARASASAVRVRDKTRTAGPRVFLARAYALGTRRVCGIMKRGLSLRWVGERLRSRPSSRAHRRLARGRQRQGAVSKACAPWRRVELRSRLASACSWYRPASWTAPRKT